MTEDMELFSKLAKLERMLHREQGRLHREGRPFADTSRGQGRILAMLKMKDGISTKDLSYLLGIRVSSLNETLAKMEKNGYISRKPSEEDRRVSIIYVTGKGRNEIFEQAEPPAIFDCFSDEEKENFGEYLDRLIAELEARNSSGDSRESMDEKWMEMMKNRMGEEWYEHVMAVHGFRRTCGREEEASARHHQRGSFGNQRRSMRSDGNDEGQR